MKEEYPIDQAMHEMRKIMKLLEKSGDKILSAPLEEGAEKEIEAWEKSMKTLIASMNEEVKKMKVPPQLIQDIKEEIPKTLPSDEQETLKRIEELKKELEALRDKFKEPGQEKEPPPSSTEKKKSSKGTYKSKFKRIGGDDWKSV